ncbi:MAG TPA: thioesterase family protein [Anaerolineaceae bacterium]|jgi:predicted thioesterase
MSIQPGLTWEITHIVEEKDTAFQSGGEGYPRVLSTPRLISMMETVSASAVAKELSKEQTTVGSAVQMRHLAATPVGMEVRVHTELVEVNGRRLCFRVEAWDQVEKIGECDHERFIIDWDRFCKRLAEKEQAIAPKS